MNTTPGNAAPGEVAVVAGTPYDTALGIRLLAERGVPGRPYPLAGSPDEQDLLQYAHPKELNALFAGCLRDARDRGVRTALVFCNSLAAVVDHDAVSGIGVISPAGVYRSIPREYRELLVLAGNAQAAVGFERSVVRQAGGRRVLTVCDQALVRAIEAGDLAAGVVSACLSGLLLIAERRGVHALVLACTHFTGILSGVRSSCSIPVIDVGSELVRLAAQASLG
jgi:glutamate racemase